MDTLITDVIQFRVFLGVLLFATGIREHSTVSLCLGRQKLGGRSVPQERERKV